MASNPNYFYQLDHAGDNQAPGITAVVVILTFVATSFVAFRLTSRRILKLRLAIDDYSIVLALLLDWGLFALAIETLARDNFGRHAVVAGPAKVTSFLISVYAFNLLYTICLVSIKIAILLLYRRIFSVSRFKILCDVMIGIMLLYGIAISLTDIFNCWPIKRSWDKTITTGYCISPVPLYLSTAVFNMATDLIILVMPIRMVWKLQATRRQKIGLYFVFGLGIFVCATTAIRIWSFSLINLDDATYTYAQTVYWTYAELNTAIVCSCLPTIRPIFGRIYFSAREYITIHRASNRSNHDHATGDRVIRARVHNMHMQPWPSDERLNAGATAEQYEEKKVNSPQILQVNSNESHELEAGNAAKESAV